MVQEKNIDERITGQPDNNAYHNLFGSGIDDAAIIERNYQDALLRYPLPKTCPAVNASIQSLKQEIKTWEEKKVSSIATGGNGKPEQRSVDGLNKRLNELIKVYNEWFCADYAEKQEHEQYLSDFNSQLSSVKSITSSSDNTGTIIFIVMAGLVVVGAGILLFKMSKSKSAA